MKTATARKSSGGRPPKFDEPRRPITVTLPERTLRQLAGVHPDRAQAIAKLADAAVRSDSGDRKLVEAVEVAPGKALLIVACSEHLKRIPGLRLVEIAPARFLISVPSGTPVEFLEVGIEDALADIPEDAPHERELLEALRHWVRSARRDRTMSKAEILFVDIPKTKRLVPPA